MLTDENGFRLKLTGAKAGMSPQMQDQSARPGSTIPWVEFTLTNAQNDRATKPTDLLRKLYLETPKGVTQQDAGCSKGTSGGYCSGLYSVCERPDHVDDFTNMPKTIGTLGDNSLPAAASWKVRCFSDLRVKEGADPAQFRYYQEVDDSDAGTSSNIMIPLS